MIGCFFDTQTGAWSAQAVMNYTVYRMMRKPDIGYERALSEFCSAFGAAADDIRAYCAHLETVGQGLHPSEYQRMTLANPTVRGGPGGGNCTFMLIAGDIYDEAFFAKGRNILAAAARKTASDRRALGRVRYLEKGLTESYLTYRTRVAQKSGDEKAFAAAFDRLRRYRAEIEGDFVCDYSYHCRNERYAAGWKHDWMQTRGPHPELVKLVGSGKLKEARASWWGYDPENSTRFLQAAIDSGVPRLTIDPRNGPWNVDGLRGVSGQELYFEGEVDVVARRDPSIPQERPLLDLSGLSDVRLVGFGVRFNATNAPGRVQLSVAGSKRVRIEGARFNGCDSKGIVVDGVKHCVFREVTRMHGGRKHHVEF